MRISLQVISHGTEFRPTTPLGAVGVPGRRILTIE